MSVSLWHRLGVTTPFDSARKHVTSPFVSATVLAGVRLLLAFYTLFTLLFTLIWDGTRDDNASSFFSFFTNLSYIGLCAYFFASGVQTFAFARSLRAVSGALDVASYPLQRWPRLLQFLHVLLQVTIVVFPIIVTIVFWVLLASPRIFERTVTSWTNISEHALNTVFALSEVLLTNIPPAPWLTLPFGFILLACYLGVAYITHETQGFYAYAFLNPQKQGALLAAYIVGIAVGYAIVFLLVRLLILLRIRFVAWLRERRGGGGGGGGGDGTAGSPEPMEEWEEVQRPSKDVGMAV